MKHKICKCGCGKYVIGNSLFVLGHKSEYTVRQKLCACGCRQTVVPKTLCREAIYVLGHNRKGKGKPRPDPKLCECNCGEYANSGSRFISGHNGEGLKRTQETREKMHVSRKRFVGGRNNKYRRDWRKYHPYLSRYEFKDIQQVVRNRDGYRCVVCTGPADLVHHVIRVIIGYRSKICDHPSNLVCLCRGCHIKVEPRPDKKERWMERLQFFRDYLFGFDYKKMLLEDYI